MINNQDLYESLRRNDVDFYTGVPDSLLKHFCAFLYENVPSERHIITPNEGNAVALASGYHMATGKYAMVYLQNSGLGNIINPITSLCCEEVYGVPMLLMIGWRGEPGVKDAPQHSMMGRITPELLKLMNIPYSIVPDDVEDIDALVAKSVEHMKTHRTPYAWVVRKNTFPKFTSPKAQASPNYPMLREEAIRIFLEALDPDAIVVSTTGKTSRELYAVRQILGHDNNNDFLNIGAMGHCSHVALGIAMQHPDRTVVCLDGDGALLMHMGSLASLGVCHPANLRHVVINNGAHESVGGQATAGFDVDFCAMALASGYTSAARTEDAETLTTMMKAWNTTKGPSFLEVRTKVGSREDLGRPSPPMDKFRDGLMKTLGSNR